MSIFDISQIIGRRAARVRQDHAEAERKARQHAKQIAIRLRRANRARGGDPILIRAAEALEQLAGSIEARKP